MNSTKSKAYGQPAIGCYLDHANYSNDELSGRIIDLAVNYGMEMDADLCALLALTDEEKEANEDYSQLLSEASDEAIDWLNSQETRSFLYWANEGEANAFGLWPNVEDAKESVGFVSVSDRASDSFKQDAGCDSEDSSYPAADYRGEWLHVNDHGNATLYVRGDNGKDTELWSVV